MASHDESVSRYSPNTSSSARSTSTVKPTTPSSTNPDASTDGSRGNGAPASSSATASNSFPGASSRRGVPKGLKADENESFPRSIDEESQVSPTATPTRTTQRSQSQSSPASNAPGREKRMSDFSNYRRDLSVLDAYGGRVPQTQRDPPSATGSHQIAPWMSSSTGGMSTPATVPTSLYNNDSSDNLSPTSQLSPAFRPGTARPVQTPVGSAEYPDAVDCDDERRPSIASVTTTASSQASKTSGQRGGFRKLQGFFGEEFPGKDSSETSLPTTSTGKEQRSQSYSHSRPSRDRNHSNATDSAREASPVPSRPRTPVPAPEVVPFLYQEADDIAWYGEAPIRGTLSGPDRDRYASETPSQVPPKTSSSSRSAHAAAYIPGQHHHHHHRHNKSNDDPRVLKPTMSREDSTISIPAFKDRSATTMYATRSRAKSPTPSGSSNQAYFSSKTGTPDGQTSPGGGGGGGDHHHRKGFLGRLRRGHKDHKEESFPVQLRNKLAPSSHSLTANLTARPSRQDTPREGSLGQGQEWSRLEQGDGSSLRPRTAMQATFNNKFPFAKKARTHKHHDDQEEAIGPMDRQTDGRMFHLDTNLSDMEGILNRPPALAPMDSDFLSKTRGEGEQPDTSKTGPNGAWNAPDSWAVRRTAYETAPQVPEGDDAGSPPRPEERSRTYTIRLFKSDGTFATLSLKLDANVQEVMSNMARKIYLNDGLDNYHIILKKHELVRVLGHNEWPLLIQKRLLEQVGHEERDRIEDLGREDNNYLCRFLFLSARESDFHSVKYDVGFGRMQKFNHVDLSGRNLVTIPISLYSKAAEIISLNLSRNLSLDLPRDFVQSCLNLRDVKFNNNEARRLPLSLGRASKLTYLDVSNNRLEQLEHAELDGLTGLLKLSLANNRLKYLPPYFGAYRVLRTLNISSNFLEKFPTFLCDLDSLVDLDLSFNLIGTFPETIGNLKSLEKFVITNNRLSGQLPETFGQLQSLRELDIKFNAISSIDVISELPRLEILTADHNAISQFCGSFETIRTIKLSANPITKFSITSPVPTLKVLNLSNAQLASVDDSFQNIPYLERLVLDKNYFASLPAQIGNLRRLESFSIANNSVGKLPPEIGCLQELKFLDVRGNNLRRLPKELWWANQLETLNVSSNVLTTFPKPTSRPPQSPAEPSTAISPIPGRAGTPGILPASPGSEGSTPDDSRRPSQGSSTLLSVGPSPVPGTSGDRKSSVVSVYGKGGRKTSVVSRSTNHHAASNGGNVTPSSASRKDSGLSARLTNTFAGSLRTLCLADNQFDDDVFDQITLLPELRVLNLSWNVLTDMPQRTIKNWPQLVELYLSGNDLTHLPADDLEEYSLLQVLHINSNKFTNLPADISRAKKLAVLDCGSNYLKYNIANVPYDWNWNLNPNLRFLNLSGNQRLEIKQTAWGAGAVAREQYTDFSRLQNLRVLGLMDVTLTQPSIPDQSEDCRVRTSGSVAGYLPYGMADTLGVKNEHLSTIDLVVPRFNSSDTGMLLGLFDGQALSSGGSKIAKYLHENFGRIFTAELRALKPHLSETPEDALRRAFISLNKDLVTVATQHTEERPARAHRGSTASVVLSKEDLNSGGVATVVYLQDKELYVANVGDAQAMLIQADGSHKMLTKKHDPADPVERARIRDAGGWVSRNGRLNDLLEVSRAFGYADLLPAVQAAPQISRFTVREQDEVVLIATRELWEYLAPRLIVDVFRSERGDLMRAAQKLRDLAIGYGSTSKIMVMMISVADLRRRSERSRLHRGQSMSLYPSGIPDGAQFLPARRGKKQKGEVLDSTLQRLEAEVPAPTGMVAIVFTDIKNSTNLWETYPAAMRSAIKLHNEVMRRQLRRIGGFEVKTEGDAFMVSFPTATSALLWSFAVQLSLLEVNWPPEMLNSVSCQPTVDKDNNLIFKGLSVRMGIHWGEPLAEPDPITRRMDYYGPMVNKASRISAVAEGGQITVSSDFASEIQRCLETYQEAAAETTSSDDSFDGDGFAQAIRKELRTLTSEGFEVKEMGEKKLKGLENPELVYSLYPHALVGRIEAHQGPDRRADAVDKPASLSPGSLLAWDTEAIWALWSVSLRLEMLCSSLEEVSGRGLQPPETELLERMKQKGGEVTERFLVNFMEHQVSRIETCISTLAMRHLAAGGGPISQLDDLRAPMSAVLDKLAEHLSELHRYKAKFGEIEEPEEGSDTEQE